MLCILICVLPFGCLLYYIYIYVKAEKETRCGFRAGRQRNGEYKVYTLSGRCERIEHVAIRIFRVSSGLLSDMHSHVSSTKYSHLATQRQVFT